MVQVKKAGVRDAILSSAKELFEHKGYNLTTVAQIAGKSSVTTSNVYNYFPSKLDIFNEVYTPWYYERLERLEAELRPMGGAREKLGKVFRTILGEMPTDDHCFPNNLVQAMSARPREEGSTGSMLPVAEKRVSEILRGILPESRRWLIDDDVFSHFLLMAFDGFALHARLTGPERRLDEIVGMLCEFVLGSQEGEAGSEEKRSGASSTSNRSDTRR